MSDVRLCENVCTKFRKRTFCFAPNCGHFKCRIPSPKPDVKNMMFDLTTQYTDKSLVASQQKRNAEGYRRHVQRIVASFLVGRNPANSPIAQFSMSCVLRNLSAVEPF